MNTDGLIASLRRRVSGHVNVDHDARIAAARDFGGVTQRIPRIVVWPKTMEDVAAIVQTARQAAARIAVRGAGHSQGGQTLSQDGIIVQTQHLNKLETLMDSQHEVVVGAGMLWRDLVDAVVAKDRLPFVLTDNLNVTIGGTLAVGGLGPMSFRLGAQIDHCSGLEVVLGNGDVVWLSAQHRPRLFHHVLGGLGQFGIITKVKLPLRTAVQTIHHYYFDYDDLEPLFTDCRRLMKHEAVNQLSGFAVPHDQPVSGSSHRFVLIVSTELGPETVKQYSLIDHLSVPLCSEEVVTLGQHLNRLNTTFEGYQRPTGVDVAHPWVEHFMPLARVGNYVRAVTAAFPQDVLLLWPLRTANMREPMLCLPEAEEVVLVGILCWRSYAELDAVLSPLRELDRLGSSLGGTRYLSGWIDFDAERWSRHFGAERWKEITALQREHDPDGVFTLWNGARQ